MKICNIECDLILAIVFIYQRCNLQQPLVFKYRNGERKMRWFKHESRAHSDAKIEKLLVRYGIQGYGLYFYCLELIVETIEPSHVTFELEHDAEIISRRINLHPEIVQEMMKYMMELGLFDNNNGRISCSKILKRFDTSMTSNPEIRKVIKNYHDRVKVNHDTVMTNHDSISADKIRSDKIRYIGENNSPNNFKLEIENPTLPITNETKKRFLRPTIEQIQQYCNSRHNDIDPEQFYDFYETRGWKLNNNVSMKDWKAAIRTWEKNSHSKIENTNYRDALLENAL